MRDIKADIASRLAAAGHAVDHSVVEELAQHAEAAFVSARAEGLEAGEATARVSTLIDAWVAEGARLRHRSRTVTVEPPAAGSGLLAGILHDVRYAWRLAWRRPGPALVAALTMALGIGAATTLFSVTWGVLMKPLPWTDADRIIRLQETRDGATRSFPWMMTNATLNAWTDAPSGTIESVGAYRSASGVTVSDGTATQRIRVARVSASIFDVLRVVPARGRAFTAAEEAAGKVIVLTDDYWQRQFGAAPEAIGRVIQLDGESYEIIGVLPPAVSFPDNDTLGWIPFRVERAVSDGTRSSLQLFNAIARLQPDATASQAAQEATARSSGLGDPGLVAIAMFGTKGEPRVTAQPLREAATSGVRDGLWLLLGAVGLLLATAVANVASVQLARAAGRRRELAVRAAIGAGGGRLARQLIMEALVVGLAGGLAGLGLAIALTSALPAVLPADFPRVDEIGIDPMVVGFALLVSLAASLTFGAAPVLQARRIDLRTGLTDDAAATGAGFRRSRTARMRAVIMAGQVAVACLLLVGASLLVRSFSRMLAADRGYDTTNVLTARIATPDGLFTSERRAGLVARTLERLRGRADVIEAGSTSILPLMNMEAMMGLRLPEMPGQPAQTINTSVRTVSPGYFEAMGIGLVEGRTFDDRDTGSSAPVLIVNETFARQYLSANAVGRSLPISLYDKSDGWLIAGIVRDVRIAHGLTDPPQPEMYISFTQVPHGLASQPMMVVRARTDASALAGILRQVVAAEEPSAVVESIMTMEERVLNSLARPRLYAVVLTGFAISALAIVAVGLFGVLSYSVSQRSRELGVRAALGARPAQIVGLVLREGLVISLAGLLIGMALAVAASRWVSTFLYGVAPHDALTFTLVPVTLLSIAVLACLIPARRAARLDPLRVLRSS